MSKSADQMSSNSLYSRFKSSLELMLIAICLADLKKSCLVLSSAVPLFSLHRLYNPSTSLIQKPLTLFVSALVKDRFTHDKAQMFSS